MKYKYALFIIIIFAIFIILFILFKPKKGEPKKITNIKKVEFFYTTGNALNADVYYKLDCNSNCTVSISPNGFSRDDAVKFDVDKYTVLKIQDILNKYKVSSWDGFSKADNYVLDGNSFSLIINSDIDVDASGYMMYPKNYSEVKKELDRIFMDIYNKNEDVDLKPIIYLYPERTMDVSVKLGYKSKITVSYPEYNNGWSVTAYPNGKLIDKKTNRELYSLFWEGINTVSNGIKDEGFVVEGKDISNFLEEKLEILGLNDREIEEFIIYWFPKLKNNKYNYIRFETLEEQKLNMPLIVNPKPDTVIRVNMEYMKLDKKIKVEEQQLENTKRNGFTVVEWGGTELK